MKDPYNWNFPQRNQTMFMATIQNSFHDRKSMRLSSFQSKDIQGTEPKRQIPQIVNKESYIHSAQIQSIPQSHKMKSKFVQTNNLRTNDIEGARPNCVDFKTARVTNPINPRYQLPYVPPVNIEPPRNFLRNTLDISDIHTKQIKKMSSSTQKPSIEGSTPVKLFKTINAINRLEVKDINNDGVFISQRKSNPTNPNTPSYVWQEQRDMLNRSYGEIGNHPREIIPQIVNKQSKSLIADDIQGAKANSSNERRYFFEKRRQYREINRIDDIQKTQASSLKKGIVTQRNLNPLMPQYAYPQL